MTITKGIKGKVVSALRKPDIQYDYILANSRRLSESLFELYSLRVTVPSPPFPSQGETNHILCSVFLLFLGMTVIVITSLFHLIGILRIIKPIIFFFSTEPGMTKCPHPSDIYFCTFEFLYNEACYEGTEEFKIRCQNFCNGLCRIYGTLS